MGGEGGMGRTGGKGGLERLRPCEPEATNGRGRASAKARAGGGAPAPVKKSKEQRKGPRDAGLFNVGDTPEPRLGPTLAPYCCPACVEGRRISDSGNANEMYSPL
jgi:hypothetical protein